jgi:hypothetical protein
MRNRVELLLWEIFHRRETFRAEFAQDAARCVIRTGRLNSRTLRRKL